MPTPRNCWYHVVLTTYGAWLDGDPRGFRTRKHKKHIEGDYKHPPRRGQYERRLRRSQQLLVQEPVVFNTAWRSLVGKSICAASESRNVEMLAMAVGRQHVHLQVRTPFGKARHEAGILKNHAGHAIKQHGWCGKTWAKRCKAVPIRTRPHQLKVFRYILRHQLQGAWVWHWKVGDEHR